MAAIEINPDVRRVIERIIVDLEATEDHSRDRPTCEEYRRIVSDILPERTVFMPVDFHLGKLETISGILRADERRVCMLVGEPALLLLRHHEASFGTISTKSGVRHHQYINGKPWVPFTHDTWCVGLLGRTGLQKKHLFRLSCNCWRSLVPRPNG
jgi:hypothetical protein